MQLVRTQASNRFLIAKWSPATPWPPRPRSWSQHSKVPFSEAFGAEVGILWAFLLLVLAFIPLVLLLVKLW
jgi:hypothetical protein